MAEARSAAKGQQAKQASKVTASKPKAKTPAAKPKPKAPAVKAPKAKAVKEPKAPRAPKEPKEPKGTEPAAEKPEKESKLVRYERSINGLDGKSDLDYPDAPPETLADFADALAARVDKHIDVLVKVRLDADAGELLSRLGKLMRTAQARLIEARGGKSNDKIARTREGAIDVRSDLIAAFRYFAMDDMAVQRTLDEVQEGSGDADLLEDLNVLAGLAETHKTLLDETDLPEDPAGVARKAAEKLHGAIGDLNSDSAEVATMTSQRNRVYWTLRALVRKVTAAGRYAFRKDPKRVVLFGAFRPSEREVKPGKDESVKPEADDKK